MGLNVGSTSTLTVRLFGRLTLQRNTDAVIGLHPGKLQELFCYLLLERHRIHARESLASLFWGECDTARSRKYLRQALWQLQCGLNCNPHKGETRLLRIESDSAGIDPNGEVWLDVAIFEKASADIKDIGGAQLDEQQANSLAEAIQLYRGDLLEGWYQDWCLFERERLQNLYLSMLDKLVCYCAERQLYQSGLAYGERILKIDRAHERTHQRMLRLLYLSGNRAGALHQYRRCVAALAEELQVKPAEETVALYKQICSDHLEEADDASKNAPEASHYEVPPERLEIPQILTRLRRLKVILCGAQTRVQRDIDELEHSLERKPCSSTLPKRRAI